MYTNLLLQMIDPRELYQLIFHIITVILFVNTTNIKIQLLYTFVSHTLRS